MLVYAGLTLLYSGTTAADCSGPGAVDHNVNLLLYDSTVVLSVEADQRPSEQ